MSLLILGKKYVSYEDRTCYQRLSVTQIDYWVKSFDNRKFIICSAASENIENNMKVESEGNAVWMKNY